MTSLRDAEIIGENMNLSDVAGSRFSAKHCSAGKLDAVKGFGQIESLALGH